MLLPSAVNVALFASPNLFARDDIVITGVSTLAEETTSYIVVDGQTEETVVSGSPSVVEVAGAATTVEFSPVVTHTQVDETTISVEIEPQPLRFEDFAFTGEVNGTPFTEMAPFATTWTFSATTLSLSFSARQTAFRFSGAVSTEITIPSEHTHVTVNGVETHVDLPGLTTLIEATDSTNIIVDLPEVTTTMEIGAETYAFTITALTVTKGDTNAGQIAESYYCGTDTSAYDAGEKACVEGFTTVVTFPTATPSHLYLIAEGLTTSITPPGITTTFVLQGRSVVWALLNRGQQLIV